MASDKHAAMLRSIKYISGMLHHPDQDKVFKSDEWNKLHYVLDKLVERAGLAKDEILAYRDQGAECLEVVWSDERGRHVFRRTDRE